MTLPCDRISKPHDAIMAHEHRVLHATALSYHKQGILLQGDAGLGKSETALCLIDRGAILVADDMVVLYKKKETLFVAAPSLHDNDRSREHIRGKMALRGIGIIDMPYQQTSPLSLSVTLRDTAPTETPHPVPTQTWWRIAVPSVECCAFEHTTAIKILYALRAYAPKHDTR